MHVLHATVEKGIITFDSAPQVIGIVWVLISVIVREGGALVDEMRVFTPFAQLVTPHGFDEVVPLRRA